jgi:succinate-semialdehyde dehydrogenase/glutarate-semialdehyde dehydrogenase
VVASKADEFISSFVEQMGAAAVGDPMDSATTVGPLVSSAQRDLLDAQVQDGLAKGATARTGGQKMEGTGFYYPPTVLTDVPSNSRAGSEELFGPVAVVRVVSNLEEAITVANETPWGLGGSIWASDDNEIEQAFSGIAAGMVYANAIVASSPELPFGGIKNSGYGRELSSQGIHEFVNAKTFFVA